jgi:hypothetical protein
MTIIMALPGRPTASSGRVAGTVFYRGRPMAGGLIYFIPEESGRGERMCAGIDKDGHFECDPEWRRDPAARQRFRISVVPGPFNLRLTPPESDSGEGPEAEDRAGHDPAGDKDASPRIIRASLGSEGRPSPERSIGSGWRRGSGRGMIIQREVWLGPEPVHIALDLKD